MKLVIFVKGRSTWSRVNPIELPIDPEDLSDEDKLESYGRYWAERFENDIVMLVEEEKKVERLNGRAIHEALINQTREKLNSTPWWKPLKRQDAARAYKWALYMGALWEIDNPDEPKL